MNRGWRGDYYRTCTETGDRLLGAKGWPQDDNCKLELNHTSYSNDLS